MNDQTYTTVPCSAYDVIAKEQIHVLNTCDTAPNPVINMVSCLIQNRHGEYNNAYNTGACLQQRNCYQKIWFHHL